MKIISVFPHFIKNVPKVVDWFVDPPERPGPEAEFSNEPIKNGDAVVEVTGEL
jgi:hypothetical protein